MITEEEAEAAVNYMRDNARKAAQASANRKYLEEYRKVLKGSIMRENPKESLGTQEAIAYSHDRYLAHLKAMQIAIEEDEYQRWMMTAADAKYKAWQTQSRNTRAG